MTVRIVCRLDVKPPNLVKGINLEGFRVMGRPADFTRRYYESGIDEISYQDVVASLYGRNTLGDLVSETANGVFIPMSVGGGIRGIEDIRHILRSGADKVVINTGAIAVPGLVTQAAELFGSQAIVVAVEAIRHTDGWEALTDSGREHTGVDAVNWIEQLADLGAGEVLVTSVNKEGTRRGFDLDLISKARGATELPLIAHGGAGCVDDVVRAARCGADAVAIASLLHYDIATIGEVKEALQANGFEVRR